MKFVVFFKDKFNINVDDLIDLSDQLKECVFVDDVYIDIDFLELKALIDKEV